LGDWIWRHVLEKSKKQLIKKTETEDYENDDYRRQKKQKSQARRRFLFGFGYCFTHTQGKNVYLSSQILSIVFSTSGKTFFE